MLPRLDIIFSTFRRRDIALKAVELLTANLLYSGPRRFVIAVQDDDGTLEGLEQLKSKLNIDLEAYRDKNITLGDNLNTLISYCSHFIMQLDDDHHLVKPIQVDRCVEKLLKDSTAGMIRIGLVAGHNYQGRMDQLFWRLDWNSPELYMASFRPHIKHIRFHEYYGMHPIRRRIGATEEAFCHQCRDIAHNTPGGPDVFIPLDMETESSWDHVGQSWQLKGY